MKGAQYFSHDSNARNDEKMIALRMKYGWEGYGIYWAIIEKLRESTDYQLTVNFNLLAFDLRTDNEKIKSIVTGFGLFTIDDDVFYSQSLCDRMLIKDEASGRARQKALKRWGKNEGPGCQTITEGDATAMLQHSNSNARKVKESKGKKDDDGSSPSSSKSPGIQPYLPPDQNKAIALADYSMNGFVETYAHLGLSRDQLARWLDAFHRKLTYDGAALKQQLDYRNHFASWIKFQAYSTGRPEDYSPVKPPVKKATEAMNSLKTGIKHL